MYPLKFHPSLNPERWSLFSIDQQLLMIGNEVNRLINGLETKRPYQDQKACMERAFELVDLTISLARSNLQKELLTWRDLFATLYLMQEEELNQQKSYLKKLLKALLFFDNKSALCQI